MRRDQPDLFYEPEELDLVLRRDFDFERNGNRSVVALRQVKRTLLLLERVSLLVYFRRKSIDNRLAVSALAIPSALAENNTHLKSRAVASTPQSSPANDMPACDTIIWVAFIRPLIQSGITRCPATQSSEARKLSKRHRLALRPRKDLGMAYDSHQRIDHGQSDTAQNGHLVRFESLSGGLKYEHSTGQRSESHAREYQPEVYSVEVKSLETNDWKQGRDCPINTPKIKFRSRTI